MSKKEHEEEMSAGKQLNLIDVAPENAKKIIPVARRYKVAQAQRIEALGREIAEKQKILALVKEAKLQPVDGKIRFRIDGLIITVTPRDELVRVKDEEDEDGKTA